MKTQVVFVGEHKQFYETYIEEVKSLNIYDAKFCTLSEVDSVEDDKVLAYFVDFRENISLILERLNRDHINNIVMISNSCELEMQKNEIKRLSMFNIFTTIYAPIFNDKLASCLKLINESYNNLYIQSIENMDSIVVMTDKFHSIVYVNNAFTETTGYNFDEVYGENPDVLKSDRHSYMFYDNLKMTLASGVKWVGEICNKKKDGSFYWEDARIFSVAFNGKQYYVKTSSDITHKMEMMHEKESELDLAESIQRSFLSDDLYEKNITIRGSYYPYKNVSGDIYKWMKIEDGKYCLLLADVIGHGVGSALLTTGISYMFKHLVASDYRPEKLLFELNNRVMDMFKSKDLESLNYFTALYMVIDIDEKTISYSNCGHPKAYVIDHGRFIGLQCVNFPIGLFSDVDYISKTYSYQGSCEILAFTDGLVESDYQKADNIESLKSLLNEYIETSIEKNLLHHIEENLYKPIHSNKTDDVSIITVTIREDS